MQISTNRGLTARLRRTLVDGATPDGGWPYYRERTGRLEPTCWALLALSSQSTPDETRRIQEGLTFLRVLQREDGLLVEPGAPGPNYAWNGLALLADAAVGGDAGDPWRNKLVAGLLKAKGIALEDGPIRQNHRLQAWSWIDETFSWIEPTALCLVALKKARVTGAVSKTRIADGEAVIVDRVCTGGGWNYGNSQVLSQDLRAYVPTTALALLAMQDRREHVAVTQSLEWLTAHAVAERSSMALSLAAICLQVFGRSPEQALNVLATQEAKTQFLGNTHLIAMATLALALPEHRARMFDVMS